MPVANKTATMCRAKTRKQTLQRRPEGLRRRHPTLMFSGWDFLWSDGGGTMPGSWCAKQKTHTMQRHTRNITRPHLSVRVDPTNPNHHLWNNHGTWWLHFTVHDGAEKRRERLSLRTTDLAVARKKRDTVLSNLERWIAAGGEVAA